MTNIPAEHIQDAHKLNADGQVELFEITPIGAGTVYIKADNAVTWQGQNYEGVPLSFTGVKKSSSGVALAPKLTIGDGSVDLAAIKPLVFDGWLEGASIRHIEVLVDNLLGDRPVYREQLYRVKRVDEYHRLVVGLQLATSSDALGFTLPHRQYHPPAFPSVTRS